MADVFNVDVDDWVQTLDKQWHQIVGIKFHTRKGEKPHACVGKHEKPKGLIRDWSITTKDGLVLGMKEINRYATKNEIGQNVEAIEEMKTGKISQDKRLMTTTELISKIENIIAALE